MSIKIGIIGYGYWGPNLVRNFSETPEFKVTWISDINPKRLALAAARYPAIKTSADGQTLFDDPNLDAVAIATPVSAHFELALRALRAGKHVFIEKPLTETVEQAERLIEEARKRNLILQVDHTFIYTGAVRKIRDLVREGVLGDLYYYDSVRINLGLFQPDISVLWDLAVHDLSIMDYVFPAAPVAVSATGINHVEGQPANIAFLTVFFENSAIAHLHVNWLAPVKMRRTLIGGSRRMVVYDDLEPSEKIKVYDKGITLNGTNGNKENIYQALIDYRSGDMWAPRLEIAEALRVEAQGFGHSINQGEASPSDGAAGLRVVRILEAATRSLRERGNPVELARS
ncbi:Predicted dehydrogenase [Methylomagnum ishizawai]|uniref:Predicted dehydrogenase n=1 Tax=Methylomagnum ishizawai TaxID=1760988 RepID=A0A1Y6D4Z8_9GAMM|nr:Gfo/Idh/MocA family oxidoreductase [Methylomagnum ishizawai]SMF97661.1 Predicted dehydrogenase [Methylomagnum ishizawai]